MAEPIREYRISHHAAFEMMRRGVPEAVVRRVMNSPDQRFIIGSGRDVLQSKVEFAGKMYLVRVIANVRAQPVEIVTVYRTSNIAKYWRTR